MAGAGYKLYSTGDVLTASDVNTYIQQQTVMVFADASARTTALTGVVAEGMLTYLKDTDVVQYYSGSGWVTVNTDQTPLTTKGDLFTYSTQDARLAVGNNGETLVADSSVSTGLRWQGSQAAGKNAILNGAFDFWQRGTSSTTTLAYGADRWYQRNDGTAGNATWSRQAASLEGFTYCMRMARNNGSTSTGAIVLLTSLESQESIKFANKPIVFSFWARKGANYSQASSALNVIVKTGTGTDENGNGTYTGQRLPIDTNTVITTTWTRYSFTATLHADTNEISAQFYYVPSGTAGAADYVEITGVQLELGSVATSFTRAGGTLAGELAACQRYYYRQTADSAYSLFASGIGYSGTTIYGNMLPPVTMRVEPTSLEFANIAVWDGTTVTATSTPFLAIDSAFSSKNQVFLSATIASGGVQYRPYWIIANNSTSAYVGFSAEL